MPSRRFALIIVAVTTALSLTRECGAWGLTAHRIIGQIAWHYLTPEAKARIAELLGDQSLGEAGCWADECAVIREVARRGSASRFRKTDRGHFTVAKVVK